MRALLVAAALLLDGCFDISCELPPDCYTLGARDGESCVTEGQTCEGGRSVDTYCACEQVPLVGKQWQCTPRDLSVPLLRDLSLPRDLSIVDGSERD